MRTYHDLQLRPQAGVPDANALVKTFSARQNFHYICRDLKVKLETGQEMLLHSSYTHLVKYVSLKPTISVSWPTWMICITLATCKAGHCMVRENEYEIMHWSGSDSKIWLFDKKTRGRNIIVWFCGIEPSGCPIVSRERDCFRILFSSLVLSARLGGNVAPLALREVHQTVFIRHCAKSYFPACWTSRSRLWLCRLFCCGGSSANLGHTEGLDSWTVKVHSWAHGLRR